MPAELLLGASAARTGEKRAASFFSYRYETTNGCAAHYLDLCARSARTFRTRENLARTHAANAALAGSGAAAATAAEAAKYGPGS